MIWRLVSVVLSRAALVALGLLLALIVFEVALQAGALYVRLSGHQPSLTWTTRDRRVVCMGDSNTWGLYLDRSDAYPAVLQELWNGDDPPYRVETLNLGAPGMNSSLARARFREIVTTLLPDMVLLMIGVNDFRTAPVPADDAAGGRDAWLYSLWRASRVFRFLYMLRSELRNYEFEHVVTMPTGTRKGSIVARYGPVDIDLTRTAGRSVKDWVPRYKENLTAIATEARRVGVRLLLLTYPSERKAYANANRLIRETAADLGVPVIDLGEGFRGACADLECTNLMFFDQHANAKGQRFAAVLIRQWLLAESQP